MPLVGYTPNSSFDRIFFPLRLSYRYSQKQDFSLTPRHTHHSPHIQHNVSHTRIIYPTVINPTSLPKLYPPLMCNLSRGVIMATVVGVPVSTYIYNLYAKAVLTLHPTRFCTDAISGSAFLYDC